MVWERRCHCESQLRNDETASHARTSDRPSIAGARKKSKAPSHPGACNVTFLSRSEVRQRAIKLWQRFVTPGSDLGPHTNDGRKRVLVLLSRSNLSGPMKTLLCLFTLLMVESVYMEIHIGTRNNRVTRQVRLHTRTFSAPSQACRMRMPSLDFDLIPHAQYNCSIRAMNWAAG